MSSISHITDGRAVALPVLVLAMLFPPGTGQAQTTQDLPPADDLIARFVEAVGGRDAVLAPEGSHSTGTFRMPAAGIQGTMEVWSTSDPQQALSVVEIPGLGTIRNGYTRGVGWSQDPNLGPRLLEGEELASRVEGGSALGAIRDPSVVPGRETVELTQMNGEACYRVRLTWASGRETYDCYSVESGLLIASESSEASPMGDIPATTLLQEYRRFGDVLSASRIVQQMMGQEQIIELETVEYGPVPAERFEPPAPIQALMNESTEPGGT